jgi:hypothetical protein
MFSFILGPWRNVDLPRLSITPTGKKRLNMSDSSKVFRRDCFVISETWDSAESRNAFPVRQLNPEKTETH